MLNSIDAISHIGTKVKLEVRGGRVKKVRHEPELEEQAALITWANKTDIGGVRIGEYLLHIPNEGKRGPKARKDAKRLGLRAGVSDLFLALPRGGYAGLWLEMKAIDGKPTAEQVSWLNKMIGSGYAAVLCYGFIQAKERIESYLQM
ncbi:VRR-NUC domain-containing protein [Serratia fonticola]